MIALKYSSSTARIVWALGFSSTPKVGFLAPAPLYGFYGAGSGSQGQILPASQAGKKLMFCHRFISVCNVITGGVRV